MQHLREQRKPEFDMTLMERQNKPVGSSVEEELDETRGKREEGWMLIKRAWLDKEDVKNEAASYSPDNSIDVAYEKKVSESDELADRLRREADRVAQQAEWISQKEKCSEEIASLQGELDKVEKDSNSLKKDWSDMWQESGIVPLSPKEMRSWITKQNRLVQEIEKLRTDQNRIDTLKSLIDEHRAALNECLADLGEKPGDQKQTLASLIDHCQEVIDLIEEDNSTRKELEKEAGQLQESLSNAIINNEDAAEEFSLWQSEWSDAIQGLRLPKEATPTVANTVLTKVEELFKNNKNQE